jgi:nitrogen fixation protein NifB
MVMGKDHLKHPCFNGNVRHRYGRVHLPVAPKCNIQCNFCNRKYDCVNESRPGVTSKILSPGQALRYVDQYLQGNAAISTIGIAGPGDPLANPAETLQTLRLVHEKYPELLFCLATNGLNLSPHIAALAELGVTHATLTINAIDPKIGARIYAWIRDGKVIYRGQDGAAFLIGRQLAALAELKKYDITVKINAIIIPGINDGHLAEVAQKVKELGADVMNCIPLFPAAGSNFAALPEPSPEAVALIRRAAEAYLPQMKHCARCRADAAGLIGATPEDPQAHELLARAAALPLDPGQHRPYVAVATLEGLLVNAHLGEAANLHIFKATLRGPELVAIRPTPAPGGGTARWIELCQRIADCHSLLVGAIGESPSQILKENGIKVLETGGLIDTALTALASGREVDRKAAVTKCGFSCKGDGMGCG